MRSKAYCKGVFTGTAGVCGFVVVTVSKLGSLTCRSQDVECTHMDARCPATLPRDPKPQARDLKPPMNLQVNSCGLLNADYAGDLTSMLTFLRCPDLGIRKDLGNQERGVVIQLESLTRIISCTDIRRRRGQT